MEHLHIDENLHSRQLAVYGREAMHRMATSAVLISGANGLGVEISGCKIWKPNFLEDSQISARPLHAGKNVILAGVRSVTVQDKKKVDKVDLSAQFYLTEEDIGKNRAEACRDKLQELNTAVAVSSSTADLTEDFLKQFQVTERGVQGCPVLDELHASSA